MDKEKESADILNELRALRQDIRGLRQDIRFITQRARQKTSFAWGFEDELDDIEDISNSQSVPL